MKLTDLAQTCTRLGARQFLPHLSIGCLLVSGCGEPSLKPITAYELQQQHPFALESSENPADRVLTTSASGEMQLENLLSEVNSKPKDVQTASLDVVPVQDKQGAEEALKTEKLTKTRELLQEIANLRTAPPTRVRELDPSQAGVYREVELTEEEIEQARLHRLEQTIPLAKQVLQRAQNDHNQRDEFLSGVQFLLDARMTLATSGKIEHAQLLSEDADSFYQHDSTSYAAVESAARLVGLAQSLVRKTGESDSKVVQIYAREARRFALNFPQDSSRSAVMLIHSGSVCEKLNLLEDAELNYALVEQAQGDSQFASLVSAPLRRLRLPGSSLNDFGGPTLSGKYLTTENLKGPTTVLIFWSSDSAEFQKDLPKLQAALDQFSDRLQFIGVNLDLEEGPATEFVTNHNLGWESIFFSEKSMRGEQNLIARYYSVKDVPSYWLLDGQGVVRNINIDPNSLATVIEDLHTPETSTDVPVTSDQPINNDKPVTE